MHSFTINIQMSPMCARTSCNRFQRAPFKLVVCLCVFVCLYMFYGFLFSVILSDVGQFAWRKRRIND